MNTRSFVIACLACVLPATAAWTAGETNNQPVRGTEAAGTPVRSRAEMRAKISRLEHEKAERTQAARRADLGQRARRLAGLTAEGLALELAPRLAEVGLVAPAEQVATLLLSKARLDLQADTCRAQGRDCEDAAARAELEAQSAGLLGLSMDELDERLRPEPPNATRERPTRGLGVAEKRPTTESSWACGCDLAIYSMNRYMDGYWALECGNSACLPFLTHGGHGYCPNDTDVCHSPGQGAMTGRLYAYMGWAGASVDCPDDHITCFKGPMSGSNEWGATCSCDTQHSTGTDPSREWYVGGSRLWSPELVYQAYGYLETDGGCWGNWLEVYEQIQEHDIGCCDDNMGVLGAAKPAYEGYNVAYLPASATNCNGGSQSGVPPNCGQFGATIVIESYCQSIYYGSGSCLGYCGGFTPYGCSCTWDCSYYGDCCWDYYDWCGGGGEY